MVRNCKNTMGFCTFQKTSILAPRISFFFFGFLSHCYGAKSGGRGRILEAYAIPPTLLSGCVDVNGYRHCADGMLVRLNVHQGVRMKLWSASTMIFLFFGGAINADWQCWESRCLAVSGLKRNFLGERLRSLDVAVNRFTLCKPSRR